MPQETITAISISHCSKATSNSYQQPSGLHKHTFTVKQEQIPGLCYARGSMSDMPERWLQQGNYIHAHMLTALYVIIVTITLHCTICILQTVVTDDTTNTFPFLLYKALWLFSHTNQTLYHFVPVWNAASYNIHITADYNRTINKQILLYNQLGIKNTTSNAACQQSPLLFSSPECNCEWDSWNVSDNPQTKPCSENTDRRGAPSPSHTLWGLKGSDH